MREERSKWKEGRKESKGRDGGRERERKELGFI